MRGILITYDAQTGAGKVSFFGQGVRRFKGFPGLERGDIVEATLVNENVFLLTKQEWTWPERNQSLTTAELDAVRCPEKMQERAARRQQRLRELKVAEEKREKEQAQKRALRCPATMGYVKRLEAQIEELKGKVAELEKKFRLANAGWRFGDAGDFLGLTEEERAEVERRLEQTPKVGGSCR